MSDRDTTNEVSPEATQLRAKIAKLREDGWRSAADALERAADMIDAMEESHRQIVARQTKETQR